MNTLHARNVAIVALLLALSACAALGGKKDLSERPVGEKNRVLSGGYGQLYEAASGLKLIDKLLLVKVESDEFDRVITAISTYAGELSEQLEKLDKDYPSLSIDKTYLPELEVAKRKAASTARIKDLAPFVGRTGKDFERTLLLTESGAINQQKFLAEVMIEAETSEQRKTFLRGVAKRYGELYRMDVELLNKSYFSSPGRIDGGDTDPGDAKGPKKKGG